MVNFIIIHGSYGSPNENWFPWLKKELTDKGFDVEVPTFPTPENQSLDSWMEAFDPHKDKINSETIFISHSLGPAFVLSLLEKYKAKASFCVAPFLGLLDNPEFDEINKTFTTKEFDFKTIKKNCLKNYVYASTDDPYVPNSKSKEFSECIDANYRLVMKAGHFNAAAGYTEFQLLLTEILSFLDGKN